MNYIVNNTTHVPAYIQLYNQLKEDIVKGAYSYGSKLPSKRTLASEAGVSTITVEHAYDLLCEEGYIESHERSGYYVSFRQNGGFASTLKQDIPRQRHHGSQGSLYEFPFSVLAKTMRRVINDYGETILERSPNFGCLEFREALKQYLARNRGIYIDSDQIIIGSGTESLYSIIVGLLGRERIFALESPSYEKIEQVYSALGATCDLLPLGPYGIDSPYLWETKASVLHITPYRSFPTGITVPASKRYEYLRWAEHPDHFIVEDDFESEFTILSKPEETLFSIADRDNVIYLNTFSKTISPSLRVGYMVLPKSLIGVFSERVGFFSCTVPTFEQYVLTELIKEGDFERHINRVRRMKRKNALGT